MPTYEYKCDACGHRFEQFQNMNEKPLETCPECGGKVERLLGAGAGFILKSGGYHATEYAQASSSTTRCGKNAPCCGRETPCNTPPCGEK